MIAEVAARDDARLAAEAYALLERVASGHVSDTDLARLDVISKELDRRNVPYEGRW